MNSTITVRSCLHMLIARIRVWSAIGLLGLAVFNAGCVAVVAAGAAGGAVAWVRGAVVGNLDAELDRAYRATQDAVADLQLAKISERKSGVDAEIVARTATDRRVVVTLEKSGLTTKVHIRVDLLGDQQLSLTVLDKIKARL